MKIFSITILLFIYENTAQLAVYQCPVTCWWWHLVPSWPNYVASVDWSEGIMWIMQIIALTTWPACAAYAALHTNWSSRAGSEGSRSFYNHLDLHDCTTLNFAKVRFQLHCGGWGSCQLCSGENTQSGNTISANDYSYFPANASAWIFRLFSGRNIWLGSVSRVGDNSKSEE